MRDAPVVVVKVGTKCLAEKSGEMDLNYIRRLSRQICELADEGYHMVLVTSGAVRCGMGLLGLSKCRELRLQQASAAVGQIRLMQLYADFFREYGRNVAQVLLTRGDVTNRRRYLNARNTLLTLLAHEVVPIINENDTIAVEEIQFGENDQLASQVVQLVGAEKLLFLTDTDGFYLPSVDGGDAELVDEVVEITPELEQAASGSISGVGSGGMATKLAATRAATRVGCEVIMTCGKPTDGIPPVTAVVRGERRGTRFLACSRALTGRKRWLAQSGEPTGDLVLDSGAVEALIDGGKSLLAVGIKDNRGEWEPGALVRLLGPDGEEVGRGLVNYSSVDVTRIRGVKSWDIPSVLGFQGGAEVIHRDNLALTDEHHLHPETPGSHGK